MEVHFTPEQEAQIAQVAANIGTDPERLVKDAALRLLPDSESAGTNSGVDQYGGVNAAMRALGARIQPDPEGWTARDYVLYGRR